ncbi:MAG: hypothetical protein WC381_10810 [Kiritimatiellia bacterium]|jgi:hypothetical protein
MSGEVKLTIRYGPVGNWAEELNRLGKMIQALQEMPEQVAAAAHAVVQAQVPVYTGAYKGGIKLEHERTPDARSAMVGISEESLGASIVAHPEDETTAAQYPEIKPFDYEYGLANAIGDKETFDLYDDEGQLITGARREAYPKRIEREGSPVQHEGKDMWTEAAAAALDAFSTALSRLGAVK